MSQQLNDAISQFAQKVCQRNHPTQTAYGLLSTQEENLEGDSFCVLLPITSRPPLSDDPEASFEAKFDGNCAKWENESGQTVLLGSEIEPLHQKIAEKMSSPDGVLVLFINERTAMPETWAVCHKAAA